MPDEIDHLIDQGQLDDAVKKLNKKHQGLEAILAAVTEVLSKEISALTGQPQEACSRRLQEAIQAHLESGRR